jgi:hypothetical protein
LGSVFKEGLSTEILLILRKRVSGLAAEWKSPKTLA